MLKYFDPASTCSLMNLSSSSSLSKVVHSRLYLSQKLVRLKMEVYLHTREFEATNLFFLSEKAINYALTQYLE